MLKRKISTILEDWKKRANRKCLIIEGARQVGKTFIVREFGKRFSSFIELNFIENPSLKNIFQGDLSAEDILTSIRLYFPGKSIVKGDTLIFLDEIQECSEAITALKFLAANKDICVICTGSALGMAYRPSTSFPVGSVERVEMHSLDFEEFLWAKQVPEDIICGLRDYLDVKEKVKKVPLAIHEKMNKYLKEYMVIGGMPEVVQTFININDYFAADQAQRRLYQDYISDIARYAEPNIKIKAEKCYKSIPVQLSKDNHKFQYSVIEHKATATKFGSSIDWIVNAHMGIEVHGLRAIDYPLKAFALEDSFRIYPNDIGLLVCTYGYELKIALLEDGELGSRSTHPLLGTAKGGLYEALAADMLSKAGHKELYFYRGDGGSPEIEFLIEKPSGIIPIEIKAGRSGSRSLSIILENEKVPFGYKFASQNIGQAGKKITLPLYLLMFV